MKVLIADDSPTVLNYLEHILIEQGYDVVTAQDGQRAWEILDQEQMSLAILDWVMPGLDGIEICKRLQEKQKENFIYVILLTSKKGDENIVAALQAGASDYLVKPFQPSELFARLRVGERTTKLQMQVTQRQKLEAIGRLAAGVAHEINTPIQFIGDNTRFLRDAFTDLGQLFEAYERFLDVHRDLEAAAGPIAAINTIAYEIDRAYLLKEIPMAISQTLEGVERVAKIVRAMKEFAHPSGDQRTLFQINKAIESTIVVTRSEWKEVADIVVNLDPALPLVSCLPGPINQVLLNLIVNAAQAIAEKPSTGNGAKKGTITITTSRASEDWTEIRIADTGPGIPEGARAKIFDPFFTTKPVGKGTGQGLALAYSVVVENHKGAISFETKLGEGTTFLIRLPNGDV